MKICVTKEDIQIATRNDCRRCPIALAIWAAKGGCAVEVGAHKAYVTFPELSKKDSQVYALPEIASKFILDFDGGASVTPIEFEAVLL